LNRKAERTLLSWIYEQRLTTGDSLPSIAAVSKRLGVRGVVIREAMQSPAARGVLEIGNGGPVEKRNF
ncbi:MAG: GntR family transcriptional regulator, partial [Spirochaetota bacterium]